MKKFEKPQLLVVEMDAMDVIATSDTSQTQTVQDDSGTTPVGYNNVSGTIWKD